MFDDELQDSGGYVIGEVLKGTGTYTAPEETEPEETEPNEQEGEQE